MSEPQSLYTILGVDSSASTEEIRKAYKRLVRTCHPDVAGDSPENQQRFADLQMAHEILTDPEKRAVYDRPSRKRTFVRSSWRPPGGTFTRSAGAKRPQPRQPRGQQTSNDSSAWRERRSQPEQPSQQQSAGGQRNSRRHSWRKPENQLNLDDIFGELGDRPESVGRPPAQNAGRAGQQQPGEDIELDVKVPVSVAIEGGTVEIQYRRNRRGDGLSVHPVDEIAHLRVPPNTSHHQRLTIDKMGHSGSNGGRSGDLHCRVWLVEKSTADSASTNVNVSDFGASSGKSSKTVSDEVAGGYTQGAASRWFQDRLNRQARSSETRPPEPHPASVEPSSVSQSQAKDLQLSLSEAVLGGRVTVDTPRGPVTITIPPMTSSGRKFRIRAEVAGAELILRAMIVLPTHLDQQSLELIRRFAELNPEYTSR